MNQKIRTESKYESFAKLAIVGETRKDTKTEFKDAERLSGPAFSKLWKPWGFTSFLQVRY